MDARYRALFNAGYGEPLYERYLADFSRRCNAPIAMQIAQTPVFLPRALRARCELAGAEILAQLCDPRRIARMRRAIPDRWKAPRETPLPTFAIIDFAVVVDDSGELAPKLIELQGFPTLVAYETMQRDAPAGRQEDQPRARVAFRQKRAPRRVAADRNPGGIVERGPAQARSSNRKPRGSIRSTATPKHAARRNRAPVFCGMSGSNRARRKSANSR